MGTVLRQRRRMLQSPPETLVAVLLGAFLFLPSVSGNAAEQKSAEAAKTPPPPLTTIPVEEVATQATQVGDLIRGFAANVAPSGEIETIRKFLPQVSVDIALELKNTTNILKEQPSLETLQAQQEIWQQRQSQGTAWLKVLTDQATKLQVALTQLKKLQETWARTRDAEESAQAPPPILQQIDTTLAVIEAAQQPHQAQRDEILNLQSKVAELVAGCNTALAQIAGLQHMAVGDLHTGEPAHLERRPMGSRPDYAAGACPQNRRLLLGDILLYVRDPSRHLPRHVAIFIALSLVLLAARRQVGQGEADGGHSSHATAVFDHVFAAALLVTLMIATSPASPVPVTVKRLFQIAALVPIIVLTRRTVISIVVPVIYALGILFATDTVRRAVVGEPLWVRGYSRWRPSQGLLCWVGCGSTEPVEQREVWAKRALCGGWWLLLFYSPWPSD